MLRVDDAPATTPGDLNQLEASLREAVTQPAEKKPDAEQPKTDAPADKFAGKSREDVVEMYRNLQSEYGRMANDLGTQRKLTDRLLDLKRTDDLAKTPPKPAVQVRSDELLENPTQAIEKVLESRLTESTQQISGRLSELEAQLARERFVAKHPDYMEYPNNPEFIEWIGQSPLRQRFAAAAAQGDPSAADDLLSEYKLVRSSQAKSTAQKPIDAARQVSLEGGSSPASSSSGKVYRRADLIRLKIEKPHVYADESFQQEIMRAYAEGRVK